MHEEEMCEHKNIKSSCEFCYIKQLEKENKELRHAIVDDDSITEHKEILEFAEDLRDAYNKLCDIEKIEQENEALKSKLGQQIISKLGDSKEALLITLKFRDNIDMLRYQSFCVYCGHILKVSDHYCEKCKERISVPMTLSDESLKELKDRLVGLKL